MTSLRYLLRFIEEDAQFGDITSEAILGERDASATIIVKEDAVIAGLDEAVALFTYFDLAIETGVRDGEPVQKGTCVLRIQGSAKKILLVERTALNIIGRMSGIATKTARYAALVHSVNPKCRVAGTRKTAPGLRMLDKKAISLGRGEAHRFSLSDGILIKDNHLALVPLKEAIASSRKAYAFRQIEVEVENPGDAAIAAYAGADIILLDNMKPGEIQTTLDLLQKEGLREKILLEISGGMDEQTIQDYARLTVDIISIGALTHSVKNIDVSLEIFPAR
ncbi:MAG: carboxylating nicotinate-nucleotide diphosphorylase [Methanoregulaceae archaeon]